MYSLEVIEQKIYLYTVLNDFVNRAIYTLCVKKRAPYLF